MDVWMYMGWQARKRTATCRVGAKLQVDSEYFHQRKYEQNHATDSKNCNPYQAELLHPFRIHAIDRSPATHPPAKKKKITIPAIKKTNGLQEYAPVIVQYGG